MHGLNPTAIEDLAVALSKRYKIKTASSYKNPILRLLDFILIVLVNHRRCKIIIVDVFSTHAFLFSCMVIASPVLFTTNTFSMEGVFWRAVSALDFMGIFCLVPRTPVS